MEGHALPALSLLQVMSRVEWSNGYCPECQSADSVARSRFTRTNRRCEMTGIDGGIVYWRS